MNPSARRPFKIDLRAVFLALCLPSCQTQEDIHREQLLDSLAKQMRQGQSLGASTTVEIGNLKQAISELRGQVEQSQHDSPTPIMARDLSSAMKLMEAQLKRQEEKIKRLEDQLVDQGHYLKTLLKKLGTLADDKATPYETAMSNYKKGHYKTARTQLAQLEKQGTIKGKKRARILHNLGMSEYLLKNDQNALVFFSKLYTEFPKSRYNANGLLSMARALQRLKKHQEAQEALQTLVEEFPKHKRTKEGKKLLEKIKANP